MLALGFILGGFIATREFMRKGRDPNDANNLVLVILIGAIVGAKINYLFDNWSLFVEDPFSMMFSPGGLTFFGGWILAVALLFVYVRIKKLHLLETLDSFGPAAMIGYGLARLGCHFAGDGDYGFPTTLPWGFDYSKGTFPPSLALKDFPEVARLYPQGIPDNLPLHPAPVYELIICLIFFAVLWSVRKKIVTPGKLFSLYLMLAGIERFAIEFIRLNPRHFLGLTQAQMVASILFTIGLVGWFYLSKKKEQAVSI
jgi:phosphatidylglycerol:prolipoprotein diacylglycerol transferase